MPFFAIQLDTTELISAFERGISIAPQILESVAEEFRLEAPFVVQQVFQQAIGVPSKGFPAEYAEHLLNTASMLPVSAVIRGWDVYAGVDLDELGTYADLERGFHYMAYDIQDNRISLPYQGQELKNSFSKRYAFWQAVVDGTDYTYTAKSGKQLSLKIPEDAFERTINARVAAWGNKAPEWLILNYGIDYYPYVAPSPIREMLTYELNALWERLFAVAAEEIVSVVNGTNLHPGANYQTYPEIKLNSAGRLYYAASGRFVKGG